MTDSNSSSIDSIPPCNDQFTLYSTMERYPAEVIRYVFEFWGMPFIDERIRDEEARKKFIEKTSITHLPALQVNGKFIELDKPIEIARFVANKHGHLRGRTAEDRAEIEEIFIECKDYTTERDEIFDEFNSIDKRISHQATERVVKVFPVSRVNRNRKQFFSTINMRLEKSTSGFLVGNHLTWVDFLIFDETSQIMERDQGVLFFHDYPKVAEHHRKISGLCTMQIIRQRRLDAMHD